MILPLPVIYVSIFQIFSLFIHTPLTKEEKVVNGGRGGGGGGGGGAIIVSFLKGAPLFSETFQL